jgi:tubulin-specific chaperone D
MDDEYAEGRLLSRFEKYDQLVELQNKILSLSYDKELTTEETRDLSVTVSAVNLIVSFRWVSYGDSLDFSAQFAEYQEQSFLLDPFLEGLVTPAAVRLRNLAELVVQTKSRDSTKISGLSRISILLYHYIKFRGHKSIGKSCSTLGEAYELMNKIIKRSKILIP